jgi:hypothetical protein
MLRTIAPIGLTVALAACSASPPATSTSEARLVFLTRDGCVNSAKMLTNLEAALRALNRAGGYQVVDQDVLQKADPRSGYPTPTLLYANRDLFGMAEPQPPFPEPT